MTRVAVVSSDSVNVDGHFGKAERFLIYDLTAAGPEFVAMRASTPLSVDDPDHPFDPERFAKVLSVLHDCEQVFSIKIGDVPAAKLKEQGIEPLIFAGPIADLPR